MSLPFLFPENLLFHKIFSGALIILGVLGAYFTRTSPPTSKHRLTSAVCYCKQHDRQRASPFSQKSFAMQNLFGNLNNIWCPRCVFNTSKSTKMRKAKYLAPFFHVKNSVMHGKVHSFIFSLKRTQSTTLLRLLANFYYYRKSPHLHHVRARLFRPPLLLQRLDL